MRKNNPKVWMQSGKIPQLSMAGFVVHHTEHIPNVGEYFEYNGRRVEIVDKDGVRIDQVIVYPEVRAG